jgi:hypothetical protein
MFRSLNRPAIVGVWVSAFVAVAGIAALSGVPITTASTILWVAACIVPPAVMLLVWRGAPPPTVAEILHTVDQRD